MKYLLILLSLLSLEAIAEPDLPEGYDYVVRIVKPFEQVNNYQVYSAHLVKPTPEGFDGKPIKLALSLLNLTRGQYIAIKNMKNMYVGTEQKVVFKPGTTEIVSDTLKTGVGESVQVATEGFAIKSLGVGFHHDQIEATEIHREVTEMLGGDAICIE